MGARRRRRHGHRAAQHGARRPRHARTDHPQCRRSGIRGCRPRRRRQHRPRRRRVHLARAGDRRLQGAAPPRGGRRRRRRADGEPPSRARRADRRRLPPRLPRGARRRRRPGRAALARHRVRPGARRLLRLRRHGCRGGHAAAGHRVQPRQGVGREDEPARRRCRDLRARAAARVRPHVHGRRLPLRRPHRGRRARPLRRAARRVRGARAQRVGGDPGARSRGHGRLPRHPRPHRGALAAGLRRTDLLLQDRRGVPVVAQRPPDGVPDGRRPARRTQPPPPLPHRRARERVGLARATRARGGALALAAHAQRHRRGDPGSGRRRGGLRTTSRRRMPRRRPPTPTPTSRCSRERPPAPVDQPGDDQVRHAGRGARGHRRGRRRGHRPLARARAGGRPRRGGPPPRRLRAAAVDLLPRRILHDARGPRPARLDRRQSTRHRGDRDPRGGRRPRLDVGVRARRRRHPRRLDRPHRRPRPRGRRPRRARPRGPGGGRDPRDRAAASDVRLRPRGRLDAEAGARPGRAVRPVGRGRHGRHLPRLVGPRGASAARPRRGRGPHRDLPGLRLEDPAAGRRAARAPLPGRRRDRLRSLTAAVEATGYTGDIEVEIFNQEIWDTPFAEAIARTAAGFEAAVVPHLAASVTAAR